MNNQNYNKYTGARYVPLVDGEWSSAKAYEPLTVVTYQGASYTSKRYVPIGVPISNQQYWVLTGNYNGQVEQYRQEVQSVKNLSEKNSSNLKDILTVNVKDFGAKGDGVTDDTTSIQNAINSIKHDYYLKGGARLLFPVPEKFYKISSTLDFTEIWNTTIECPSPYNFQRQGEPNVDNELKLLHWFGAKSPIIKCDYSYSLEFKNISVNGRNISSCGFQFHPSTLQNTNNKFITLSNCMAYGCDVGYDVGETTLQTDDCPITFYSCYAFRNRNVGIKINSGNDGVKFFGGMASNNGESPNSAIGVNIHVVSGEVSFHGFVTDGTPVTSDIRLDGGGLSCFDFWSDVSQGAFLTGGGSSVTTLNLNSVRHYDANMTSQNTPFSIRYNGKAPLVLTSCYLYNNVEVNEGNQSHIIDLGTTFVNSGATFTGTMVTNQRGLISINKQGQNEARLSIGKNPFEKGGNSKPFTQWAENNKPLTYKTTNNYTVTESIQEGSRFYEILGNCYNDSGIYKSISTGSVWRVVLNKNNVKIYYADDSTLENEVITWNLWAGFSEAIGGGNNNPSILLKNRKINFETSAPSTGSHTTGDIVYNQNPSELGEVGSKYIVLGWQCIQGGTPGAWLPLRTLTGN